MEVHLLAKDVSKPVDAIENHCNCLFYPHFKIATVVGLGSLDPGSELVAPNKSLHYWPFWHQSIEHVLKSHPKQYGGMLEPSFHTQRSA